jgi:Astacin (Peptidase family M12A)/Repeat of unknown function (DUF346)
LAPTKIGYISGNTFQNKRVEYEVIDGLAVFEGDIILGTVYEMERTTKELEEQPFFAEGVVVSGEQFRWPWGIIPFAIDSQLQNQQRVTDAIRHWEDNTPIRFVPKSSNEEYWVLFRPGTGCLSYVGKRVPVVQGRTVYREQPILLADGCTLGNTIHEIGHAVGLWHEQSREDRDNFVTINWDNIMEEQKHNFEQHITDGDDIENYDYCSIMHYGRFFFCRCPCEPCPSPQCPCVGATIDVLQPNLPCANNIGQRVALSNGDIRAVRYTYGRLLTSGPGAVSWGPGRIDVFGLGKDRGLWHQAFDGTWHSWEYLGGGDRRPPPLAPGDPRHPPLGLTSSPDVCSMGSNHLDVFVRNYDNALWHRWCDATTWYDWSSLGGYLTSGPGAVSWGPGRIDVFARNRWNQLQHKTFDGTWHNWEYIEGGLLTSDPDVVSGSPNYLDVFVRGGDNALWHQWFDGTTWSGWHSLGAPPGGYLTSGPSAVSWGPGRIDVFARNSDDALWHRWYDGGTWWDWESLGGTLTSDPDVCSMGPNHLDVFVRGTDGALWHQWFDGTTWSGWDSLF